MVLSKSESKEEDEKTLEWKLNPLRTRSRVHNLASEERISASTQLEYMQDELKGHNLN